PFYRINDPASTYNEYSEIDSKWCEPFPEYCKETGGKLLTDDLYGDIIVGSDAREDIPVGRIVGDSIEDMISLLNNSELMKKNNATILSGTLEYGEDYTRDVADEVKEYLSKENVTVSTLYWGEATINPENTLNLIKDDNIVFAASHANPGIWSTDGSVFIKAKDIKTNLSEPSLILSLGCHNALLLKDMDIENSIPLAFIRYGAGGFIGNTGFGSVSNEIAYSELFYSELIRRLIKEDITLGSALLYAKQGHFYDSDLDKKIVLEAVLYGNPKSKLKSDYNKSKKRLMSKKHLYIKSDSEPVPILETPFHRVQESTDLSSTYTGRMISRLEIDPNFISNIENTYIINNTIVPSLTLEEVKVPDNVVIKDLTINNKLSETELIELNLTKIKLGISGNVTDDLIINPNWTNVVWETVFLIDGSKKLKTNVIPLKPYNDTHYYFYKKMWIEATYTKSLIQITDININDNNIKIKIENKAQTPENIEVNLVVKKTNDEIVEILNKNVDVGYISTVSF
ncbi:MAG: C25 family cysteine peptidase, partial [Methanosarcinales archaeon]